MAINYQKVGWDTTKYVNPTNMNKMDNGIKSACDGVDQLNATMTVVENKLDNKTTTSRDIADSSEGGLLIHHIDGASTQNGTPTPTSPVPIDSVSVKVKTHGKNILVYPYPMNVAGAYQETTFGGITFTPYRDHLYCHGTSTRGGGTIFMRMVYNEYGVIPLSNKKYRCIVNWDKSDSQFSIYWSTQAQDGTVSSTHYNASSFTIDNTDGSQKCIYGLGLYLQNGVVTGKVIDHNLRISIVEFDDIVPTVDDITPYFESNADTSLVLRSIGDIKDELIFEDNKYKVLRRIGHERLDSTYFNSSSSASGTTVQTNKALTNRKNGLALGLSNGFIHNENAKPTTVANANSSLADGEFAFRNYDTNTVIYLKHSSFTTTQNAMTFFDNNEIYFDYELETPTVEELTDEAIKLLGLKSWNEQTHITLDSVVDTPITVEYATNNGNGRGLNGYTVALANEIKLNQLTMATMLSE